MILYKLIICSIWLLIPIWAQPVPPPPECSVYIKEKDCLSQCRCMWCRKDNLDKAGKDEGSCYDVPSSISHWTASEDSQATVDFEASSLEKDYSDQTCWTDFDTKNCRQYHKTMGVAALVVIIFLSIVGFGGTLVISIMILYLFFICWREGCPTGCQQIGAYIYKTCCCRWRLLKPCCDNVYVEL